VSLTVARGDPGASRHAPLFRPGRTTLFVLPMGHEAAQPYLEDNRMSNEQVIEQNQDLDLEQEFDLVAFEQELIAEYGSLEAALLDFSDRPE